MTESKIKIRMLRTVRPEFPFNGNPAIELLKGKEYDATSNIHGAICGICASGDKMGVKPGEFTFVCAPEWVLEIWMPDATRASALNCAKVCDAQ